MRMFEGRAVQARRDPAAGDTVVGGRVRCSHEAKVSFVKPLESFEQRHNTVYDLKGLLWLLGACPESMLWESCVEAMTLAREGGGLD